MISGVGSGGGGLICFAPKFYKGTAQFKVHDLQMILSSETSQIWWSLAFYIPFPDRRQVVHDLFCLHWETHYEKCLTFSPSSPEWNNQQGPNNYCSYQTCSYGKPSGTLSRSEKNYARERPKTMGGGLKFGQGRIRIVGRN